MLGVIIILSHVVGLGWQKRAFEYTGPRPVPTDLLPLGLPAIFWAFLVCGIIVMITGYAAGYVTAAMPRSGGGYVTISRVIHPVAGFNASWLMFLAEAFSYGLIGVAVFEAIMIFYSIALAPTVVFFSAEILFLGGVIVIVIFTALALFGVRLYGWVMQAMFWPILVVTIAFFAMWISGAMDPNLVTKGVAEVFVDAETGLSATPTQFMDLALDSGMADSISAFGDAFSYALAGAFWAYMGWYSVTFIAGEVKEANKKLPMVVLISGLTIMLIYLAASSSSAMSTMGVAQRTVDGHEWSFFQAYSWLSFGPDAAQEAAGTIPNFQDAWSTGVASLIARGMGLGWLSWIIALGGVVWLANDIPPFLLVASRTMFAMSFDKMMPEKLAEVSERWHSPTWALIVTGIFGIIGCVAEAGPFGSGLYFRFAGMVATDVGDAFFLTLFCLSMMLLPLERKDVYDRAAVKHSVGFVVGLGFIATMGAGYCLMTFVKLSTGWMFAPTTATDWSSFIGFWGLWVIGGILLYTYYMYRNTTKGVDMRTLYISIPPE